MEEGEHPPDVLAELVNTYEADFGVTQRKGPQSARVVINIRDGATSQALVGTLGVGYDGVALRGPVDVRAEFPCAAATVAHAVGRAQAAFADGHGLHPAKAAVDAARDVLVPAHAAWREGEGRQEEQAASSSPSPSPSPGQPQQRSVLVRIDHMRQRASYTRILASWAASLCLHGRLFFVGPPTRPLILLHLAGEAGRVRDFLRRSRTETVDVDASGRKCKEKQADVLDDRVCPHGAPHTAAGGSGVSFDVVDDASPGDVTAYLVAAGVPPDVLGDLPLKGKRRG